MTRLLATMGTSPGSVYETLLNLCRGSYECAGESCPPLRVDTVTLVRTSNPKVVAASRIARLLIHCSREIFGGDPRALPCSVQSVGVIDTGINDIESRRAYDEFVDTIRRSIGEGDVVDVTGGRVSMAVAAALTPIRYKITDILIVASSIPQEYYQQTSAALNTILSNYDVERIEDSVFGGEGCSVLEKYPELVKALQSLVTGRAKTVVLYP